MQQPYDLNVESEENPKSLASAWISTIVFCGFSIPFFLFALFGWRELMPILITGFFAAFGVGALVMTIRMSLDQAKFGAVRFLMERPLPSIGGRLTGSVRLPKAALGAPTLVAALTCYRETFTTGKNGGWSSDAVWCGKHSFPIHPKADGAAVPIALDIPVNVEASKPKPNDAPVHSDDPQPSYWSWKLEVTVDLPGVDLDRNYPITVLPAQPGVVPAGTRTIQDPPQAVVPIVPKAALVTATPKTVESEIQPRDSSSIWVLVAANLVPIAGALFWGWRVEDIVFLYWMENLVIGAFNIGRILAAAPDQTEQVKRGLGLTGGQVLAGKALFAAFFLVHYGGFCAVHGEFLVSMFPGHRHWHGLLEAVVSVLREKGMLLALLAIVVSRGYSFFRNYIGRREYQGVNFADLMTQPYKRIFVTHIFIIAGGFLLEVMKLPVVALVLFIAIKIGADAHFHRREREALAQESK